MNTGSLKVSRRHEARPGSGNPRLGGLLGASLLLVTVSACGAPEDAFELEAGEEMQEQTQELDVSNGLSLNGLSLNGLSLNGLSLNGLSLEGLSSEQFDTWFQEDPELHDLVMKYVVRCAVPKGVSRTYTSASTGMTWTWKGNLGLAPGWTNGAPATVVEQQIVSACLAAHADKYGIHTRISVLGLSATGETIPYTAAELRTYSEREACFFGNLFTAEGIYVANDGRPLNRRESSPRACALSSRRDKDSQECSPLIRVQRDCARFCTLDASRKFYVSCTYDGVTYPAITTRILPSDIYTCGDGVCQLTESCGTGETPDNCGRDCGRCR